MNKVQRYKVGYYTDEWGMSSNTPCLVPDDSGYAVKFEDYCKLETELAAHKAENEWRDIETALEAIEQLERQLADRDAEIAKYRDAPVVAYMHPHGGLLHKPSTGLERETYTINLIVKPGE